MNRLLLLILLTIFGVFARSQNIYTALRLNIANDYRTRIPKKIIETNSFYGLNNKQVEKNIKVFDNAGMLLSEERYDGDGILKARLTYTNDTVHRIYLSRTFERWTTGGYSKETAFYTYDVNFFLKSTTDRDANGNVIRQTNLVCNDKGHPTELVLLDGDGNSFARETATYFYDRNEVATCIVSNEGRVLSCDTIKINYADASRFPAANEEYNANGDQVRWISRRPDGTEVRYEEEYKYDRYGNCTEERIFKVVSKRSGGSKREKDRKFERKYFY